MILDIGTAKAQVDIVSESSKTSPHTGAPVQVLQVQIVIRGEKNNEHFLALLQDAKNQGVASVDDSGAILKRWKLGNTSWSYRDNSPLYYHTLDIEEVEVLEVTSLDIGDLSLQPYEYKESFSENKLTIEAKVVLSEEQHKELKKLLKDADIVSVIRHGINEETKNMRFLIPYWSIQGDQYKHNIMMLEEAAETKPNYYADAFRWLRPMSFYVAENKIAIDSLLGVLANKGILSPSEVDSIHSEVLERSWEQRYEFFRVDDIDET